jgi:hypothetical protein
MMLRLHLGNPGAGHTHEAEGFVFHQIPESPTQVKGLLAL